MPCVRTAALDWLMGRINYERTAVIPYRERQLKLDRMRQLLTRLGQPDAGILAGGNFKLEGGFWSGVTLLQTPGTPILKIKLIGGGMAVISWPVSAAGFTLEETAYVAQPKSWSAVPQPVVDTATEHTVTVPAAGVVKCYRLKKP